jgi:hypothetical protein
MLRISLQRSAQHYQRHNTAEIQVAGNSSSKNFCAPSVEISGILEGAT